MAKGEWKITKNFVGDKFMYAVYRLIDVDKTDHSGNREYATGYFDSKEAAEVALKMIKNDERG